MDITDYIKLIEEDVRIAEGLNACMNCGVCTAVCPAAEYFEYDPRSVVILVQSKNIEKIIKLIESDYIWYCGQCMSCKPRCPRNNCPGLIISVLRKIAQETGAFIKSKLGRQQYLILKSVGANIFKYGYCVHPSTVTPEMHPEQGPVWNWIYNNREEVYNMIGANLDKDGAGAMRKIDKKDLEELNKIFEYSGGQNLHERIEYFSKQKAIELGFKDKEGDADMERYKQYLINNETE